MKGRFSDVNLTLREGEVLGIAGVIGSGREDVIRTLFGLEQPSQGEICIRGEVIAMSSPAEAVQRGLGFVPSERRVEGLVMMLPVSANISLAKLQMVEGPVGISPHREIALAKQWIDRLSIRPPRPSALCQSFSGGNQQKVVLAKWLTAGTRILLLDHPTRGIDVGAKEEVFRLIRQLSRDGVSIILLADTLEETIGLSHSVLVMRDGRITARVPAASGHKPPPVQILEHMV